MLSPILTMLRRPILPTAALLILATAAIACATGYCNVEFDTDAGRPYRIGVMDSLTGAGTTYGGALWQAKQMAAAEINAAGGINGRMLELVVADSRCRAESAVAAYRRLIQDDGVKIILGASCSDAMLAAAPLAQADGVVMLSASATHPDIAQTGDYIFRTALNSRQVGIDTANTMWAAGVRNLATFTESTEYAMGLHRATAAHFEELGGKVTEEDNFPSGLNDFKPLLAPLLADNPDALHIAPQSENSGGGSIRDARALGYDGPIYTEVVTMGSEALRIAGDAAGVTAIMVALRPDNAKAQEVLANFHARHGHSSPSWFIASGYDNVYLAAECLQQTGDDQNAAGFRDCLNAITWSGTISESYGFDAAGEIVGLSTVLVQPLPAAERTPENPGYRIIGPAAPAP